MVGIPRPFRLSRIGVLPICKEAIYHRKRRRPAMAKIAQFARLVVEQLEDRLAPAIYGTPWPNPEQLTLSFAPDGTLGAAGASNLFRSLNSVAPTTAWELEILRAFQTWAVNANINIAVVPDG